MERWLNKITCSLMVCKGAGEWRKDSHRLVVDAEKSPPTIATAIRRCRFEPCLPCALAHHRTARPK